MLSVDDCRWLIGPEASPHLKAGSDLSGSLETKLRTLQRRLPRRQCELILEQLDLRRRAAEKFAAADRMLFSRTLLEQATDERIARYKASRFPAGVRVVDLCCGLGGDSLSLAERGPVHAVDLSPVSTFLTEFNGQAGGHRLSVQVADVRELIGGMSDLWHLDPDRRPTGQRTTAVEACEPPRDVMEQLLAAQPSGAVKLAPATMIPPEWSRMAEVEWIGSRRECRQQVVWFGGLARELEQRRATVVDRDGNVASWSGRPTASLGVAAAVGRYLHEPHAAVLAAHLEHAVTSQLGMLPIATDIAYFTSDSPTTTPLLTSFEVLEELSLDERKLRAALRERQIGKLEIKVRGAELSPDSLRRKLRLSGDESRTLMIAGPMKKPRAFLVNRVVAAGP